LNNVTRFAFHRPTGLSATKGVQYTFARFVFARVLPTPIPGQLQGPTEALAGGSFCCGPPPRKGPPRPKKLETAQKKKKKKKLLSNKKISFAGCWNIAVANLL